MYSNLTDAQISEIMQNYVPFIWVGLFISIAIVILFYFFSAFGLMKIAKRNNVKHSWLAWIPGINSYIYGKVAFRNTLKAVLYLVIELAASVSSILHSQQIQQINSDYIYNPSTTNPTLNIFTIVSVIILFVATYKIYKRMSDKAVIMTAFSVLSCGILIPIFLFAIRNNDVKELPQQNN